MSRTERERTAYNTGSVYQNSARLHSTFAHVFHSPNSLLLEKRFAQKIQDLSPNADVLDYGCYTGELTAHIHQFHPKSITGIDISDSAIAIAKKRHAGLGTFHVMDGQATSFPDSSFDLIVGRAILHHLEWQKAIHEMHRILRPGGTAIFIEPLGDNPIAQLIRTVTPHARTIDEEPITRKQIAYLNQTFSRTAHEYYNLLSVPLAMCTSLLPIPPNNALLRAANIIDNVIAKTPLKFWMRVALLEMQK